MTIRINNPKQIRVNRVTMITGAIVIWVISIIRVRVIRVIMITRVNNNPKQS